MVVPGTSDRVKINSIHAFGEEKGEGQGLEYMKTVLSDILGQEMHYAVRIDFKAFEQLIDALGGIEVNLESEFIEPIQFHEKRVCDPSVFTVPSGNCQEIRDLKTGKLIDCSPDHCQKKENKKTFVFFFDDSNKKQIYYNYQQGFYPMFLYRIQF